MLLLPLLPPLAVLPLADTYPLASIRILPVLEMMLGRFLGVGSLIVFEIFGSKESKFLEEEEAGPPV